MVSSKLEHIGQHGTSRVLIPNTFLGSGTMTFRYLDGLVHLSAIKHTVMEQHFLYRKLGSATLRRCESWTLA